MNTDLFKVNLKQLDVAQIKVPHNLIIHLLHQDSFYSNEQEPDVSGYYYNTYDIDEKIKDIEDLKSLGLHTIANELKPFLEYGKYLLDTSYADIIEFVEDFG